MHPELKASLASDRTVDRAQMEPDVDKVYETFANEVFETRSQLNPQEYSHYLNFVSGVESYDVADISLGYARKNFNLLDRDGNDEISAAELAKRGNDLERSPDDELKRGDLPPAVERRLVADLRARQPGLSYESRDGIWWTFNMMNSSGIHKNDLALASDRSNRMRELFPPGQLLPNDPGVTSFYNMPQSVSEMLEVGGVGIKTINGRIKEELKQYTDRYPTIAIAGGFYSSDTNEIVTQGGRFLDRYREHETGHFIDDALAPGDPYFSDSEEFKQSIDIDLKALPDGVDWSQEIPTLHPYVLSAMTRGSFNDLSYPELFADIYQTDDQDIAVKLRKYFPETTKLIERKLDEYGIERFPVKENDIPSV